MDIGNFNPNNHFARLTQKQKNNVLISVVNNNLTEEVDLLIKAGANLEAVDNDGNTALMCAAYIGHTEIVRLLIQAKANLDAEANDGETALILAVYEGYTEIVRLLIEAKANLEAADNYRERALSLAAGNGQTDIVRLLIDAKANLDAVDQYDGKTVLILAAFCGYTEIVRLLIEAKANLEAVDNDGNTALSYAISKNHPDVANLLFSVMTLEQVQQAIINHPYIDILTHLNNFEAAVISHRMEVFKTLGPLAFDINQNNLFSSLPTELMSLIAFNYCARGNEAWNAPHAGLDATKIYDAMVKNGPLTFSLSAPVNNKRKAQDELEDERDVKKIKITSDDDSSEEDMQSEQKGHRVAL